MKFSKRRQSVADQVAQQTEQARALVDIAHQKLLADPRTNPTTRPQADRLRDDQQRQALTLEHRRLMRRGRVSDQRAAHAERSLDAIQNARESLSPARRVVALSTTRSRFLVGCLAASVLLSVGSAMSIETWLQEDRPTAPDGLGYLVEAGLTVLSTTMIVLRGVLASVKGAAPRGWRSWALWSLICVPLLGSIVLSAMGAGLAGVACSLGAAAWSVAAFLSTDTLSVAVEKSMDRVNGSDEMELRRQALGEDLFDRADIPEQDAPEETPAPPVAPATSTIPTDDVADPDAWVFDDEQGFADDVEAFLRDRQDPPEGGVTPSRPHDPAGGPQGTASGLPKESRSTNPDTRQIDAEQGSHDPSDRDGGESAERVIPAAEARRLKGAHTRWRVAEHLAKHPHHNAAQIAQELGVAESTARRHMKALAEDESGEG